MSDMPSTWSEWTDGNWNWTKQGEYDAYCYYVSEPEGDIVVMRADPGTWPVNVTTSPPRWVKTRWVLSLLARYWPFVVSALGLLLT